MIRHIGVVLKQIIFFFIPSILNFHAIPLRSFCYKRLEYFKFNCEHHAYIYLTDIQ